MVAESVQRPIVAVGRWRNSFLAVIQRAAADAWKTETRGQKRKRRRVAALQKRRRFQLFHTFYATTAAERRLGRRTALTFPLFPPPQKNWSLPSDSSPEISIPGGISRVSRTSPDSGSSRLNSLSLSSNVPCQSSPSIQVTPVTKRLDSMVRRIAPVSGST